MARTKQTARKTSPEVVKAQAAASRKKRLRTEAEKTARSRSLNKAKRFQEITEYSKENGMNKIMPSAVFVHAMKATLNAMGSDFAELRMSPAAADAIRKYTVQKTTDFLVKAQKIMTAMRKETMTSAILRIAHENECGSFESDIAAPVALRG